MVRRSLPLIALVVALIATATGCVETSGRLYVRVGPPPLVVERRIEAPGPDFIWQAGFYQWTGRDYVWVPGRWERTPRPRALWVPGRWAHDRRGWYFVEGHWRR